MTFDPTKPVQTRSGKSVRILCTDRKGDYPIVGLTLEQEEPEEDEEQVDSWQANGHYAFGHGTSSLDLINVPERTELFFNVYGVGELQTTFGRGHSSLEKAKSQQGKVIGLLRLVFEDGVLISAEKV
jgi:hypothetical protein